MNKLQRDTKLHVDGWIGLGVSFLGLGFLELITSLLGFEGREFVVRDQVGNSIRLPVIADGLPHRLGKDKEYVGSA